MKRISKAVCTLFLYALINIYESNPVELNLTTVLVKHVKGDTEIHQIMLLVDDVKISTENIIQNLPKYLPVWKISFRNATGRKATSLTLMQSLGNPRGMLFMVITSPCSGQVLAKLSRPINFMTKLSGAKRRPKVLIILEVKDMTNYADLFRFMWSKKFLDVTILDFQRKNRKGSSIIDHEEPQTVVNHHHFNPFNQSFVNKKYSLRSELFPDKLIDLHSFRMTVGLFHFPPHVIFTQNSTRNGNFIDGPDVRLMNVLSKAMNFKVLKNLSDVKNWDKFSCIKEENEGFFHSLLYSEIQFIGVQGSSGLTCALKLLENSRSIWNLRYAAVVPIVKEQTGNLSTDWKLYNLMALLTLIIFIWLITRLMRFDNENWNLHDLIRIVLGSTIPREPSALAERIVLGSMLVSFLLHSSVIFTAFTNINLKKNSLEEIDTLDQLISSDLIPLVHPNVYAVLSKFPDEKIIRLLEKAVQQNIPDSECLEYLVRHKNVTCFLRDTIAKWLIQRQRDQDIEQVLRILSVRIANFLNGHIMETASPYVQRFEEISWRVTEAGIQSKWNQMFFDEPKPKVYLGDTLIADVVQSNDQIRINIIFVLLFGYTCSLLAYFGEVAVYFYKKFFH